MQLLDSIDVQDMAFLLYLENVRRRLVIGWKGTVVVLYGVSGKHLPMPL
jgi:hypothetical protein